ncbi:ABC transporter permease [Mycoplasmopsis ciconiae]|uniref:ABC transporter permease n=1 Tax=Mycoplasmopsis ciconiae TaxID=561067 RepID=A0ABU7MN60_9BACT|nr:ABC transporter permease [Mycoplasmopsis ciconiae]
MLSILFIYFGQSASNLKQNYFDILTFKWFLHLNSNTLQENYSNAFILMLNYFYLSVILISVSLVLGFILGYIIGLLSAIYLNSWFDFLVNIITFFVSGVPIFILAPILIDFNESIDAPTLFIPADLINNWVSFTSMVAPMVLIIILSTSITINITKSQVLVILKKYYITNMKCNGFSLKQIIFKGIFKNSLILIFPFLPSLLMLLVAYTLIIERIFQIPGMSVILLNALKINESNLLILFILSICFLFLFFNSLSVFISELLDSSKSLKYKNASNFSNFLKIKKDLNAKKTI